MLWTRSALALVLFSSSVWAAVSSVALSHGEIKVVGPETFLSNEIRPELSLRETRATFSVIAVPQPTVNHQRFFLPEEAPIPSLFLSGRFHPQKVRVVIQVGEMGSRRDAYVSTFTVQSFQGLKRDRLRKWWVGTRLIYRETPSPGENRLGVRLIVENAIRKNESYRDSTGWWIHPEDEFSVVTEGGREVFEAELEADGAHSPVQLPLAQNIGFKIVTHELETTRKATNRENDPEADRFFLNLPGATRILDLVGHETRPGWCRPEIFAAGLANTFPTQEAANKLIIK
jgi:hypothetical protein